MAGQRPQGLSPLDPATEAYIERAMRRHQTQMDGTLAQYPRYDNVAALSNLHPAGPGSNTQDSMLRCAVCMDDLASHGKQVVTVQHQWKLCWDCLRQFFERAAAAEEAHPAKLTGYHILRTEDYTNVLGDDLIKRYNEMGERKKVLPVNRIFCTDPCGQYVGGIIRDAADNMQAIATCKDTMSCGKIWCLKCGEHLPDKAAAFNHSGCRFDFAAKVKQQEDALAGLTRGVEYQLCPKCNRAEQLTEGCSHMSCPCGQGYCYDCGGQDMHHDDSHAQCQIARVRRGLRPIYGDRVDDATDYGEDPGSPYDYGAALREYGPLERYTPAQMAAGDEMYRRLGLTPRHRNNATATAADDEVQVVQAQPGAMRDHLAATTGSPGRATNGQARLAARRRRRDLGPPSPRTQPTCTGAYLNPAQASSFDTYLPNPPLATQATAFTQAHFGRGARLTGGLPPLSSAHYAANTTHPLVPPPVADPLSTTVVPNTSFYPPLTSFQYPLYNTYPTYAPQPYPAHPAQQTAEENAQQVLERDRQQYDQQQRHQALHYGDQPGGAAGLPRPSYLNTSMPPPPANGYAIGGRRNALAPSPAAAPYPWQSQRQPLPPTPPRAPEGSGGREFLFEEQLRGPERQRRNSGSMEMDDEDETPL
ncbi:hypothetical protein B0A48_03443 [Cryoendolithus antarcticus]|uniref:RING-type domain-containing protein n=1 Tax=Cryoendolithus antarcticus TaxID=1507870 RepID=A0A1V8TK11_9PEZI|nr:hypothetical protein B0A48_03443 [Cryoendolithus antarcticus]